MSLLRNLFSTMLCLTLLAGCGFTPVYGEKSQSAEVSSELAAIKIDPIRSREGQILVTKMENMFNRQSANVPSRYKLTIKLSRDLLAIAIERDRTVTRYRLLLLADYTLTDSTTNKVIDQGRLKREGGFDKVTSDYATYVAEEDAVNRIAKELAEDFRIRLTSILLQREKAPHETSNQ